jgi:hypothetical protein
MMRTFIVSLTATAMLIGAAVAHGWRTDRWGGTADLDDAAARLATLPLSFGDWDGEVIVLPAEQVRTANVAGITARRYTHRYTRREATILLLCGRPGPVSVHTPDVCYSAVGFTMGSTRVESLPDGAGNAWTADFKTSGPQPLTLRIRWAWSLDGNWTASGSPRTDFARARVLYKLYLVHAVAPGEVKADAPELALLKDLNPALRKLFGTP